MNKLNSVLIFLSGVAAGSFITWKLMKDRYECECELVVEEDDSESEIDDEMPEEEDKPYTPNEGDLHELKNILESNRYTNYSKTNDNENVEENKEEEDEDLDKPQVISPDEFEENEDYDVVSLTLYADGVLTDERDNVIENIDELVGSDSLNRFGEYEEDSVFVRNDARMTYYEILRDADKYSDIYGSKGMK